LAQKVRVQKREQTVRSGDNFIDIVIVEKLQLLWTEEETAGYSTLCL
jgi:hypothetical protein